jgi:hypothetical protein
LVIGLDIDGTITRHPAFFALLSQAAVAAGHEVVVITFREDRHGAATDLARWGIAYGRLVSWSLDDWPAEDACAWKGHVCGELGVEVLFEDDPEVLCHVDPSVVSMMVVDHDEHELRRLVR